MIPVAPRFLTSTTTEKRLLCNTKEQEFDIFDNYVGGKIRFFSAWIVMHEAPAFEEFLSWGGAQVDASGIKAEHGASPLQALSGETYPAFSLDLKGNRSPTITTGRRSQSKELKTGAWCTDRLM